MCSCCIRLGEVKQGVSTGCVAHACRPVANSGHFAACDELVQYQGAEIRHASLYPSCCRSVEHQSAAVHLVVGTDARGHWTANHAQSARLHDHCEMESRVTYSYCLHLLTRAPLLRYLVHSDRLLVMVPGELVQDELVES